jgi:hypothetical protein
VLLAPLSRCSTMRSDAIRDRLSDCMLFQHSHAAFENINACVLCGEQPCSVVGCQVIWGLREQVLIYNSYAIKDKLRALEFRFDSERRAWVRSVFEVKRLLELEDHADITLDKILAHSESMVQVTFAVQPVSVPSFCILLTRTCCIGGVGNLSSRQRGNLSSRQRGAVDSKKMGLS